MCGIVGVYSKDAYLVCREVLRRLNHRGQDGAGSYFYPSKNPLIKGKGFVSEILKDDENQKEAEIAIGQVRYSTEGQEIHENIQPIVKEIDNTLYVVAHNGEIVNFRQLINDWGLQNEIKDSYSDSHIIPYAIARAPGLDIKEKVIKGLQELNPSWSLCILIKELEKDPIMVFARDPFGIRPLSMVKTQLGYIASSEGFSLKNNSHNHVKELEQGEIIFIDETGMSNHFLPKKKESNCIFEHIYFSFPSNLFANVSIPSARIALGKELAKEEKEIGMQVKDSIVVYAPDSALLAAEGYSYEANLRLVHRLIRSHYQPSPRSFMARPDSRALAVEAKHNTINDDIFGNKIILIDDSIVRGDTSTKLIKILRNSGALEVHVRIPSAPIKNPCLYGINMKSYEEFIAFNRNTEEICKEIGADSLLYLTVEGMHKAIGLSKEKSCNACFSGDYPFK